MTLDPSPGIEIGIDLGRYTVLRSTQPDEISERVGSHLRPHRMVTRSDADLDCTLQAIRVGDLSLARLRYGGPVRIISDALRDCYMLSVPLSGRGLYRQRGDVAVAMPRRLTVLDPREPFSIDLGGSYDQLLVRLQTQRVKTVYQSLFGESPTKHVDIPADGGPLAWNRSVPVLQMLFSNNQLLDNLRRSPRLASHVEWLVISSLLQPPAQHRVGEVGAGDAAVRRAEEYMHGHLAEPIGIAEIAAAAGVSARALFDAFKRTRDTTPMALLRTLRLDRVNQELHSAAPDSTTVTEVAMQWGFGHLGDFARAYGNRFGERPSQTLRGA